ncbi:MULTISPECIES: retron system putative HNH endonuclease [Pseudomonas]|uniref:retron system putative HNH endonuclease n=1 Tax=Pseudomonas TaxID=286 RepID=UPI0028E160B4|nr:MULTISPECIES: retron system putative HNH endonuclease [Pseudomonas]MDT9630855.1 TIGR02646 family protein [Pseudomonas sp. JV449]
MKKTLKDIVTPPLLEAYIKTKPQNEWNQFTKNSTRRDQVHKALRSDQGSVCAYCEIDLIPATSTGSADFRVEHFHPKSDKTTTRNWGLEWNNLMAVCHGGSRKDVVDAKARHTKPYTCDVPKANNIWDDVILNPLNLKSGPCLFKFDRSTGAISVDVSNCAQSIIDPARVQTTIDKLNLDSPRLQNMRRVALNTINESFTKYVNSGISDEHTRAALARIFMRRDKNNNWQPFFSAIRGYLGDAAEDQLKADSFEG